MGSYAPAQAMAMRAEYEVEGDERVGKQLVKSFDGRPYLGQV